MVNLQIAHLSSLSDDEIDEYEKTARLMYEKRMMEAFYAKTLKMATKMAEKQKRVITADGNVIQVNFCPMSVSGRKAKLA